jgi:DNA-binding NtrC family response regulator
MIELKFFVLDDDLFYLTMLKQQLLNIGYDDVTVFENGNDLLSNIEQNPDIVFIDYNMDDLSGDEVLNKIKRYNPNIFVVVISGQEGIKTAVELLKKGAFDYLQKGDDEFNKMQDVINKIIEVKDYLERTKPGILKRIFKKND